MMSKSHGNTPRMPATKFANLRKKTRSVPRAIPTQSVGTRNPQRRDGAAALRCSSNRLRSGRAAQHRRDHGAGGQIGVRHGMDFATMSQYEDCGQIEQLLAFAGVAQLDALGVDVDAPPALGALIDKQA